MYQYQTLLEFCHEKWWIFSIKGCDQKLLKLIFYVKKYLLGLIIIWDSKLSAVGGGYESSSWLFWVCIKYSPRLRAFCLCFSVVLWGWRTRFLWRFSEDFWPAALVDFPGWKIEIRKLSLMMKMKRMAQIIYFWKILILYQKASEIDRSRWLQPNVW